MIHIDVRFSTLSALLHHRYFRSQFIFTARIVTIIHVSDVQDASSPHHILVTAVHASSNKKSDVSTTLADCVFLRWHEQWETHHPPTHVAVYIKAPTKDSQYLPNLRSFSYRTIISLNFHLSTLLASINSKSSPKSRTAAHTAPSCGQTHRTIRMDSSIELPIDLLTDPLMDLLISLLPDLPTELLIDILMEAPTEFLTELLIDLRTDQLIYHGQLLPTTPTGGMLME
jgi:hypothetical protein